MILIKAMTTALKALYLLFFPLKMKNKVLLVSRQSNTASKDFTLIESGLKERKIKTIVLTKKFNKSIWGVISYSFHILRQLYHIATSKVIITDGYCAAVCMVKKKKNQKVIQIWHALGAIKKFGWQTADKPYGHSNKLCKVMNLHGNYDYVLAPGRITGGFFAQGFNVSEEKIVICGLPRIDSLLESDTELLKEIEGVYPQTSKKINVLYAPTFRKDYSICIDDFVSSFDFKKYNLIIKKHFLDKGDYSSAIKYGAIIDNEFSTDLWIKKSQKVITDYSAIAFEAAILQRDLYIYEPDIEKYKEKVEINMKLENEAIGEYVFTDAKGLNEKINEKYKTQKVKEFRDKYIEADLSGGCTAELCDFISDIIFECR